MSWSGYVDNLMGSNHMTACGIFGLDGSTWAASPNYPVKQRIHSYLLNNSRCKIVILFFFMYIAERREHQERDCGHYGQLQAFWRSDCRCQPLHFRQKRPGRLHSAQEERQRSRCRQVNTK